MIYGFPVYGVENPHYKKPVKPKEIDECSSEFKDLSLGARFNYPGSFKIWVRIGTNLIAEWDEKMKDCGWVGQSICCFSETDDLSGCVYIL